MILPFADTVLHLLPGRAVFWPKHGLLCVADLHLGRAETMWTVGAPLPPGADGETLDRLADLAGTHQPHGLVLLGDVLHSRESSSARILQALESWRGSLPDIEIHWVLGNHDKTVAEAAAALQARLHDHLRIGGVILAHEPSWPAPIPTICGHLHPALRLRDRAGARATTPAFLLRGGCLVLPAFGFFTGSGWIDPRPGDRAFVPAGPRVIELPLAPRPHSQRRVRKSPKEPRG